MTTITTTNTKAITSLVGEIPSKPMLSTATATATTTTAIDCPNCGYDVRSANDNAQQRISELEAQLRFLNTRAAETADKLADYEDEIRFLRSKTNAPTATTIPPTTPTLSPLQTAGNSDNNNNNNTHLTSPSHQQHIATPPPQSRLSSFASLLPYGRRNPPTPPPPNRSPSPTTTTTNTRPQTSHSTSSHSHQLPTDTVLQDALTREQALRKEAESRLSQANSELEELTAQLFSQANEMVAQERKARAKLEERVEVLERRDSEKRMRLERLEKAIERVERVRGMVGNC
ncbi:hypothetical protein AJ78_03049 [Emergomyces pasteurianus Ep9510]|uniref:GDP/GTP exchange factor Sec2 N-terminal domain-containing protein n=1 Tax=Emergomyces pasteurianus Ep9510 TaxID=1447872 RepID=A0A1J9PL35_9EURO|nr:hypothetical protein AJ78_03049 [Emergomyces pasteurianus Ep9510]